VGVVVNLDIFTYTTNISDVRVSPSPCPPPLKGGGRFRGTIDFFRVLRVLI